jgi:hypothetical protein
MVIVSYLHQFCDFVSESVNVEYLKKKNYDFSICKTVGLDPEGSPADVICKNNLLDIYDALFIALTDYTSDSKGDVGAWYVFISYMINVVFK